jgi:hypothetical protein
MHSTGAADSNNTEWLISHCNGAVFFETLNIDQTNQTVARISDRDVITGNRQTRARITPVTIFAVRLSRFS